MIVMKPRKDMQTEGSIFISYSHKDADVAHRIAKMIEDSCGGNVWYDNSLRGGEQYFRTIPEQIQSRTFFIFIISDNSVRSSWCKKELREAVTREKIIVPILLSDVDLPAEIEFLIREFNYIHYYQISQEKFFVELESAFSLDCTDQENTSSLYPANSEVIDLYDLGTCYLLGKGVSRDGLKAEELFTKAGEQGFELAQYDLGLCYLYGKAGIPKDGKKAVEWFTRAAEQDYEPAQYDLGMCYFEGNGVPKDETKAVEWFVKAAEQGYELAQYSLGICYLEGTGVPKDELKAATWLSKAAESNWHGPELEEYFKKKIKNAESNGQIIVKSTRRGRIEKVYVQNGQTVQAGDALVELDTILDSLIVAPISGTVKFVAAYKSMKVCIGDPLIALE